jgi:hypothetical protein
LYQFCSWLLFCGRPYSLARIKYYRPRFLILTMLYERYFLLLLYVLAGGCDLFPILSFAGKKTGEQVKLFRNILLALYIARDDVLYYSNMSTIDSWERTVHCLFCTSMATLKPTKTRRIMLRCNICGALVFANGILSQQRIKTLKDYRFTPLR